MRKFFSTRRRLAITAAASVIALAGGTAAYAYFTQTGSGTGSGSVGTAGTWTVSAGPVAGGPIYPGAGTETITFTVTNTSNAYAEFSSATASIPTYEATTDAETSADADISGCTASWFAATVSNDPDLNTQIAPGDNASVTVSVQLTDEAVDQDSCAGASPAVSLSIS